MKRASSFFVGVVTLCNTPIPGQTVRIYDLAKVPAVTLQHGLLVAGRILQAARFSGEMAARVSQRPRSSHHGLFGMELLSTAITCRRPTWWWRSERAIRIQFAPDAPRMADR